mmetsp:Transcript_11204/g.26323  ORF Transcript_11204/g.26323 Transcript_11204/m.26323 type:complete len:214 (-) Transcript_11204:723-1364(-)
MMRSTVALRLPMGANFAPCWTDSSPSSVCIEVNPETICLTSRQEFISNSTSTLVFCPRALIPCHSPSRDSTRPSRKWSTISMHLFYPPDSPMPKGRSLALHLELLSTLSLSLMSWTFSSFGCSSFRTTWICSLSPSHLTLTRCTQSLSTLLTRWPQETLGGRPGLAACAASPSTRPIWCEATSTATRCCNGTFSPMPLSPFFATNSTLGNPVE